MNDPKLDEMIKNAQPQKQSSIFTIVIQYDTESNACRLQYPVGNPGNIMFWGAIWAAMKEAEIIFERQRMMEIDKFEAKSQGKPDLVIAPAGSIPPSRKS